MQFTLFWFYSIVFIAKSLKTHTPHNKKLRIIGGTVSKPDEFPFFAQLERIIRVNSTLNESMPCGSSLIHPEWILTAAHCFIEVEEMEPPLDPPVVKVYMDTIQRYSKNATINLLSAVIIHPNHVLNVSSNGTVLQCLNDVALGKLKVPFKLSTHIKVIALPSTDQVRCHVGYIVGIGTRGFFPHVYGHYVYTASISTKRRSELANQWIIPPSNTLFFAEIPLYNKGYPFSGDSGGPFFCKQNGIPVQFGIITQSDNDTRRRTVQTAFESVDKHINFITDHIPDVTITRKSTSTKVSKAFKPYLSLYTLLIASSLTVFEIFVW